MTKKRYEYLEGFEFSSCCVRSREIFGFVAQKWPDENDPLEIRDTAYFCYFPLDPPKTQWAVRSLAQCLGADMCAPSLPVEKWCFVLKDGLVFTAGGGSSGWEKNVADKVFVNNVKAIRNGHAFAVGSGRKVFKREDADSWDQITNGLYSEDEEIDLGKTGFLDIDGFSESDIYACGRNGDLWRYDGNIWRKIDIPTNAVLYNLCCANDGFVYIITDSRDIWKGREDKWKLIQQDITVEVLEGIVEYNEQIVISTVSELYHLNNDDFEVWNSSIPSMVSKAHISSNDGVLLVAGRDEAVYHDGQSWHVILEPA